MSVREIDSCSSCDDTILIFGDYNFSEIHWMKDEQGSVTIDYSISSLNHARYSTIDGMAFCNLHQINPTKNLNGHTLDLVFSNSIDFSVSETNDVLIAPDLHHPPLEILLPFYVEDVCTNDEDQQLDFKKTNVDALVTYLSLFDWSPMHNCSDVDQATAYFLCVLNNWLVEHVPIKRKPRLPPWEITNCGPSSAERMQRYVNCENFVHRS